MAEVRRQEFVCSLSELAANPSKVLAENEFLYVRQADGKLKMMCGDGVTAISALPYTIDIGAIEQAVIDAQEGAETATASLDKLTNLTASVETLPPGSDATVAKATTPDGYALAFGIPRGDKGEQGEQGDKGDPGEVTQAELDAVTSQLAEKANETYKKSIDQTQHLPMVTFIVDDGHLKDYTEYFPIFQAKGVPFCNAVISDVVTSTGSNYMRASQLLELQAYGNEILCHTKTHTNLSTITDESVLETELHTSLQVLKGLGLNVESIVYPENAYTDLSLKIVSKYYRAGFAMGEKANTLPLNQLAIYRRTFGSYGVLYDLDGYKALVDEAKANKKWLVFMCHSNGDTAEQRAYLSPLLDYIIAQGIPIVTVKQALDKIENKLTIGEMSKKFFGIGADGSLKSTHLDNLFSTDYANLIIANNSVTEATPLTSFPVNKVTINVLDSSGSHTMPEAKTGVLETYVIGSPIKIAFQLWYPRYTSTSSTVYKRWWNDVTLAWEPFIKISDGNVTSKQFFVNGSLDHGTIAAGQVSERTMTVAGVSGVDTVVATPQYGMAAGLFWNACCDSAGTVKVRVYNATTGAVTCSLSWSISVYKNN